MGAFLLDGKEIHPGNRAVVYQIRPVFVAVQAKSDAALDAPHLPVSAGEELLQTLMVSEIPETETAVVMGYGGAHPDTVMDDDFAVFNSGTQFGNRIERGEDSVKGMEKKRFTGGLGGPVAFREVHFRRKPPVGIWHVPEKFVIFPAWPGGEVYGTFHLQFKKSYKVSECCRMKQISPSASGLIEVQA